MLIKILECKPSVNSLSLLGIVVTDPYSHIKCSIHQTASPREGLEGRWDQRDLSPCGVPRAPVSEPLCPTPALQAIASERGPGWKVPGGAPLQPCRNQGAGLSLWHSDHTGHGRQVRPFCSPRQPRPPQTPLSRKTQAQESTSSPGSGTRRLCVGQKVTSSVPS